MTYLRLPYDDAATAAEMSADCMAAADNLHPSRRAELALTPLLGEPAPSRGVEVSDSLAEMAAGLHLHFD